MLLCDLFYVSIGDPISQIKLYIGTEVNYI